LVVVCLQTNDAVFEVARKK